MNSGPESCTGIGVVAWLFVIWGIRTWLREKHERRWSESPNMDIIQLVKEAPKLATTYIADRAMIEEAAKSQFLIAVIRQRVDAGGRLLTHRIKQLRADAAKTRIAKA